jgi:hypothetical protein
MGDYVYAISSAGITATNLTTLEESDREIIPNSMAYDRYASDDIAVSDSEGEDRGEERSEEQDGEGSRPTEDDSEGASSSERSRD